MPPDLLTHSCIRIRLLNGAPYRWRFEKDGNPVQLDVEGPVTLDESSLVRTAVFDDIGIGFFMEADVREDLPTGRLKRVLDAWTSPKTLLCLYYLRR